MAKILIADDSEYLRISIRDFLVEKGHTVVQAADGKEAIAKINEEKPELILLDLMMPLLDGFQVLQVIKADTKTKKIPVIVRSALGQEEDKQRVMNLGAVDYVVKSDSSLDETLKIIEKHLPED